MKFRLLKRHPEFAIVYAIVAKDEDNEGCHVIIAIDYGKGVKSVDFVSDILCYKKSTTEDNDYIRKT